MALEAEQLDSLRVPRCDDIRRSQFALVQLPEPIGVVHDGFRCVLPTVFTVLRRAATDLHPLRVTVPCGPTRQW